MVVLIEVRDARGRTVRWCGAKCHHADPETTGVCVCGGAFRGIARQGIDPAAVTPETIESVRERVVLGQGQHVQLRIGA
jgi:hypothetical protein